ncbi:hypothetical protein HK098_007302 [Nowakowskiella sp. JEL0407]|nr:hypothetical protein HK098_007302 [Nowakowskiella sp. JEL0407]
MIRESVPNNLPTPSFHLPEYLVDVRNRCLVSRIYEGNGVEKMNIDEVLRCGYHTVSHIWGPVQNHTVTEMTGISWTVALSYPEKINDLMKIADYMGIAYLWIDILCIDQTDNDAKTRAVVNMYYYYLNAQSTIVWLNERPYKGSFKLEEDAEKFLSLEEHGWLGRLWTYQEGLVPIQLWIVVERTIMDFDNMAIKMGSSLTLEISALAKQRLRRSMMSLGDHLRRTCTRQCGDLKDRVFGLVGVLPWGNELKGDYSMSFEEAEDMLYLKAIEKGDWSFMGHAHSSQQSGCSWKPKYDQNIPNWFSSSNTLAASKRSLPVLVASGLRMQARIGAAEVFCGEGKVRITSGRLEKVFTADQTVRTMFWNGLGLKYFISLENLRSEQLRLVDVGMQGEGYEVWLLCAQVQMNKWQKIGVIEIDSMVGFQLRRMVDFSNIIIG